MLTIIIVKYNLPEYEAECVQSVVQHTNIPHHLIVHDNYEKDENLSVVWNRLIKQADSDYIILLNNDTIVESKWAERLISGLSEGIGAIGPITNKCGTGQSGFSKKDKQNVLIESSDISGFCLAFPKKVWEDVGGFNEEYHLYGEDSEFIREVRKKYKTLVDFGVHIFHYGAKSSEQAIKRGKDINKIRQNSSQTFRSYLNKNG